MRETQGTEARDDGANARTSPRIRFEIDACVWQRTGENWENVQLHFSTERPSLGAESPPLLEDRLQLRPVEKSFTVETREERVVWREERRSPPSPPASDSLLIGAPMPMCASNGKATSHQQRKLFFPTPGR
ncbi:MAG: DUF4139 domain-containing protein [Magnetococcales bacterium]|nr:DUF4139 domain-containing protein [Magnetococcales bacterium]